MAVIKNTKDLQAFLEKNFEKMLNEELMKFAEEVKKALKAELSAKWYGRDGYGQQSNGTDYYTRTFQLLDSVSTKPVKKKGKDYYTEVFYDTDQMTTFPSYYKDNIQQWSTHESIIDGQDFREHLPEVIEYGNPSSLYGWNKGFNIVGDLTERLISDDALLQHFKSALRRKGFKVE